MPPNYPQQNLMCIAQLYLPICRHLTCSVFCSPPTHGRLPFFTHATPPPQLTNQPSSTPRVPVRTQPATQPRGSHTVSAPTHGGTGGARGGSHPTQVQVVTSGDSTPLGRTLGPARTRTRAAVKTTRGGRSLARRARESTTPTTPHTQTHTLLSAHKLSSYHRPVSSPT